MSVHVNSELLTELGQEVLSFLVTSVAEPPSCERDLDSSQHILDGLVSALPTERDQYLATLAAVAAPSVQHFLSHGDQWLGMLKAATAYLGHTLTEVKHPLSTSTSRVKPAGESVYKYPFDIELPVAILRGLLQGGDKEHRLRLFGTIDDWSGFGALVHGGPSVLSSLELTQDELAVLVARALTFAGGDMAGPDIIEPISDWAALHPDVAKAAVASWLAGADPTASALSCSGVQLLVEAALRNSPDLLPWRDAVVERLSSSNDGEQWELAAKLSCFAWPHPVPPAGVRHERLRGHVERCPERLVLVALAAMFRDARSWPVESLDTALEVVRTAPRRMHDSAENRKKWSLYLTAIAWQAVRRIRGSGKALTNSGGSALGQIPQVSDILEWAGLITPDEMGKLDWFLNELVKDGGSWKEPAREFMGNWLAANEASLSSRLQYLEDLFPCLTHTLGEEGEAEWLVAFLTSGNANLRKAALPFLAKRARSGWVPEGAFRSVTAQQGGAIAHQLAGSGLPGETWIPLAVQLGMDRPEALGVVYEVLAEDAAEDYPGLLERHMGRWPDASESIPVGSPEHALADAKAAILALLASRKEGHRRKREIPELVGTTPSSAIWEEMWKRSLQEACEREEQSGRHIFSTLARKVPIIRGLSAELSGTNTRIDLKSVGHVLEWPGRASLDPISHRLSRVWHLKQADLLLNSSRSPGGADAKLP